MFIYLGTHPVQNTQQETYYIKNFLATAIFSHIAYYIIYMFRPTLTLLQTNTVINFCAFSDLFCCFFCSGWVQRRRCPSHTQESLRFFCLVCEELTCKDCQLITHKGHRYNSNQPSQISACED